MEQLSNSPMFFIEAGIGENKISYLKSTLNWEHGWEIYLVTGSVMPLISRFLKSLAISLKEKGYDITLIPCASNAGFLDGIILEDKGVVFWGGDKSANCSAHPIVCEKTIDLSTIHKSHMLVKHRPEIMNAMSASNALKTRADAFIKTAATFLVENMEMARECIDTKRIQRLVNKFFCDAEQGCGYCEINRFLSAVCAEGIVYHSATPMKMCDKVYIISDECGAVSTAAMESVRALAAQKGHKVIVCHCPVMGSEKIDHIILPDLKLAFVTVNKYLHRCEGARALHARRFTDSEKLRGHKERLDFNRRTAKALLGYATVNLAQAEEAAMSGYNYYLKSIIAEKTDDIVNKIIAPF